MEETKYSRNAELLIRKGEILDEARNIINFPEWILKKDKDGYVSRKRQENFDGIKMMRCDGPLKMSWRQFIELFISSDLTHALTIAAGKNPLETSILEWVDETCFVACQVVKCPFPLSDREFVYMVAWEDLGQGEYILNYKSLAYEPRPESPKLVRARIDANIFRVRTEGDELNVCFVGSYDVMGSIPQSLKKIIASDNYDRLPMFQRAYDVLKKKGSV
eukprot:CAMPEP_0115007478 /NCGR_PEP_ID=MMETSP0216-20121206/21213_1 /TAXON_ID=223996 /ORGANISM="Protocruzia adherens, Strain Boccale" /LENGTH=218 /DNA_ID=CAMNT_0002374447 /DNA_START=74 /DNA_END=730 /DNA_ORIENTATION=+